MPDSTPSRRVATVVSIVLALDVAVALGVFWPRAQIAEGTAAPESGSKPGKPGEGPRALPAAGLGSQTLHVLAYSLAEDVLNGGIFPGFRRFRQEHAGHETNFEATFGSLGKITNSLLDGAPADLAILSGEMGVQELSAAGIISLERLSELPAQGILAFSPVVMVVRPGNPRGIRDFSDLGREGVQVVQSNPTTSGSGLWAVLAEFESGRRREGAWVAGRRQLISIRNNVVGTSASGLAARQLFAGGTGDALVTLEQDALTARRLGQLDGEIVYPPLTILSEPRVVVLERSLQGGQRELVEAFLKYLWSDEARRALEEHHFRGGSQAEAQGLPALNGVFRIEDLGGWKVARRDILEGIWLSRERSR